MHDGYLGRHRRLLTDDIDAAQAAIEPLWEHHQARLLRGDFTLDVRQAALAHSALAYLRSTATVGVRCGPVSDGYHLMLFDSGGIRQRIDGRSEDAAAGRAALHVPGAVLDITAEPYAALMLSLDRDAVERVLPEWRRPRAGATAVGWPTGIDVTAPAGACLASFCRWLADELDRADGGLLRTPRAVRNIERTLIALFVDAVGAHLPDPGAGGISVAVLRRIEEWMEANFANPIGVEEMARMAGVSVRSVQIAFRRAYGITPSAALLACRLRHARLLLRSAGPATSVTQVALDCGFYHLGRFSLQYKRAFAESPSATLRRAIDRRLGGHVLPPPAPAAAMPSTTD